MTCTCMYIFHFHRYRIVQRPVRVSPTVTDVFDGFHPKLEFISFFIVMSEPQRSLWSETASMLSLSHTLPILRDEIEICLVTSSIFLVASQTAGFKASLVTCMLLHLIRGGSRWQLIPTYFSVFVLSAVQGYSVALTVLHCICALLTLGLCYVIPCVPLMSGRGKSLGVQDLTFDGPSGKFWIKCFYPTYGTADKPQVANFPSPSKSWMIKAVVSFGTILCAASIMKYAELPHSLPSLLWFSVFSALHLCRLVYDAQYALPSCAYISASEFSSVVEGVAKFAMLPKLIFTHMSLMRVNCTKDAPVYFGENDSKLKVAFVLHGLGGTRDFYSFICMRLAAEGYFVISPEFSDGTACMSVFPDGFKRKYVTYVPKNGDDLACEGSHIFRGKQLEHRAEEMDIIVKFFSSLTDEKMSVSESASTSKSTTSPLPTIRWKRMVDGSESFFCKSLSIGVKGGASEGSVAAGVIDIKNPFIVGHSFGAATAVHLQRSAESYATQFRSRLNR